jgi:hypothetical protein
MIEYHDHHGDEHDHVPVSGDDAAPDHGADTFADHHPPPLDELTSHADAPPELHFPGDDVTPHAASADLDPSAPWPDDAGFTQWLGGHEAGGDDTAPAAGDGIADQLAAPPGGADGLAPADELVDWTLRQLDS